MKSVKLKTFFKSVGVIYGSAFFTCLNVKDVKQASVDNDNYIDIIPSALCLARHYSSFGYGKFEQLLSNFALQTFFTVGAYKLADILNFDSLNKQAVAAGVLGALGAGIKIFISKDCLEGPITFLSDIEKTQHALVEILLKAATAIALVYINNPTIEDLVEEDDYEYHDYDSTSNLLLADLLEQTSLLDGGLDM